MSLVIEEMAELTGEDRFSLKQAADELGYAYATVREYVVVAKVCPHERIGGRAGHGCVVQIDEHGLATLRRLLPRKAKAKPAAAPASRA